MQCACAILSPVVKLPSKMFLYIISSMTAALKGGEWSAACPGRNLPRKYPVPIVQEAGWAPGPVWTDGKPRTTGIRSPDRPTRSQSLYQPSYRAHTWRVVFIIQPLFHLPFSPYVLLFYTFILTLLIFVESFVHCQQSTELTPPPN